MGKRKNIKTRDPLMVKVINGVTKAAVHKDKKKEDNRRLAREKVPEEERLCFQCYFPLRDDTPLDEDFCSSTCKEFFDELHSGD